MPHAGGWLSWLPHPSPNWHVCPPGHVAPLAMHAPVRGLQQPLLGQPLMSGPDEQQGSPVPPHAVHVPAGEQVRFMAPLHGPLNRFPPKQQGSPAPPHAVHVPLKQARLFPISPPVVWHGLDPTQQGSPLAPQWLQTPALHARFTLVPRRPGQKSPLAPIPFALPGQHAAPTTPHPTIPPSAQYATPPLGELVGLL
jgi:hypothetical protein